MNKNNPLYEYVDKLNEYGCKLVKEFMHSKQYSDLCSKINDIDKEIEQLHREYDRKILEVYAEKNVKVKALRTAKNNILFNKMPKAKDEYVREHIEGYKMHLRTKDANNSTEAYMQTIKSELNHG